MDVKNTRKLGFGIAKAFVFEGFTDFYLPVRCQTILVQGPPRLNGVSTYLSDIKLRMLVWHFGIVPDQAVDFWVFFKVLFFAKADPKL